MKGLGYRQFAGYLASDYSYEEAVRLLNRDTRHFAKRQMTWFQKEPGIEWIRLEESDIPDQAAEKIVDRIKNFLQTFDNKHLILTENECRGQIGFGKKEPSGAN